MKPSLTSKLSKLQYFRTDNLPVMTTFYLTNLKLKLSAARALGVYWPKHKLQVKYFAHSVEVMRDT